MASSSYNNLEEFDERFDERLTKFSINNSKIFAFVMKPVKKHQGLKKKEHTLKDNENKGTCSYGTIILVKMKHILLTCFDAVFE